MNATAAAPQQLTGAKLVVAGLVLALTNFMVVLDTTIANVSVTHISGSLGVSSTEGNWVITSYAVAEAICVPLTGFLAGRFGTVRTFIGATIGFIVFSMLCGMSTTLGMLVACRIGQGLSGGPLMPMTQALMMRIFPPEKRGQAMGMWGMTTVVGPILGPILGGTLSDNWSWHWIFFINLPVGIFCTVGGILLLRRAETPLFPVRVDKMGLALLVLWIGALQIMLDLGRERDWFNNSLIVSLGLIALVGFAVFLAWELTEEQPIVDVRVFRHRGFLISALAMALSYGAFFSTLVIIPQWLQSSLGYTATWSGYTTALVGVFAVMLSPVVGRLVGKWDVRAMVCFGVLWLGITAILRTHWTSGANYWTLAFPQLLQGIGMPFFFIPLNTLALAAVRPNETASAAGLLAFVRTMAGAIGTSLSTSMWDDQARVARNEQVSQLHDQAATAALSAQGFSLDQIRVAVEQLVTKEALAVATTHVFMICAVGFFISAGIIWLAPRPRRAVDASAAH